MRASLRVLGIESTCDETAAAVVEADWRGRGKILSNAVLSQIAEHAAYGGVVPEIAARAHVEALDRLIRRALAEADCRIDDLDAIAAAAGPGLIGGVMVGLTTGKAIALAANKPFIAVNHLEAHALTPRLTDDIDFPYLLLLVSGGHSQFVAVNGVGDYRRLGSTIDDAVGEAFDKARQTARPALSRRPARRTGGARAATRRVSTFPGPMAGRRNPDFSFSGLKTAVRQEAERIAPLDQDRYRRPLRLVPGGRRGRDRRPLPRRPAPARRFAATADRLGRGGRRRRQWRDPPRSGAALRRNRPAGWPCRRRTCAPTMAR